MAVTTVKASRAGTRTRVRPAGKGRRLIHSDVDGVLLTVKYNEVSRRELAEAKLQLERAGCNILGAVLNEVAFDSLSSKRYYNKSYYSSYETMSTTDKIKAAGKFSFFRK